MQLQATEEGLPHRPVAQGANLLDLCASSGNKKSDLLFSSLVFFFFLTKKKISLVTSSLYIVELQKIRVLNLIQP